MSDVSSSNWSETDASNDILGGPGWPGGMDANQVEPNARGMMGAIRRIWDRLNPQQSSGGSGGAYTWTPANTLYPTAYAQGEVYWCKANFTSVGGDTFNVNGLGAKPIYKVTNAGLIPVAASDMQAGAMYALAYDSALNGGAGGFQLANSSGAIPSGTVMQTAAAAAPAGWLLMQGQAVSRTTYPTLFAAIGTTYGAGDGVTTFNLPDGRGRFLAGFDPGNATGRLNAAVAGSVNGGILGAVGGEQYHYLSGYELAVHSHGVNDPSHIHGVGDPTHIHGLGDPTHAHGVADPAHAHSVADPTHSHGLGDPGHAHGVSDPAHNHGIDNTNIGVANLGGGFGSGSTGWDPYSFDIQYAYTGIGINGSGTGMYMSGAYTGIGIYAAGTGIGIYGAGTGIYMGYAGTGIYLGYSGTGVSIQNAGSGGPHNTVPPVLIVNHIIKI